MRLLVPGREQANEITVLPGLPRHRPTPQKKIILGQDFRGLVERERERERDITKFLKIPPDGALF